MMKCKDGIIILYNLWWILGLLFLGLAIIIDITNIRIGESSNADNINKFLEGISIGFSVSCFFYFINSWVPNLKRRKLVQTYIDREIVKIKNIIRRCAWIILTPKGEPFSIPNTWVEYEKLANCKSFDNRIFIDWPTYGEYIIMKKRQISDICLELLSNYSKFMRPNQLKYIDEVFNSNFLIIDFNILLSSKNGIEELYQQKQEEAIKAIYDLYSLS